MTITACPKCYPNGPHIREDGRKIWCVLECENDGTNARGSECSTPWEELRKMLSMNDGSGK